MPHECTECGRAFPDGSTEMLSGCPDCGGNRFQFLPEGARTAKEAARRQPSSSGNLIEAESDPSYLSDSGSTTAPLREDGAQADARSGMVDPDHLPKNSPEPAPERSEAEPPDEQSRPDLEELREELDNQFGSIKIVDRGEYELNLMELYERRECIIELQENGRYVIELPETLMGGDA